MQKGTELSKAILIATLAHEGQFNKGGKPYILHPLTVLHKLRQADEITQSAAVLHDVLEDAYGEQVFIDGTWCTITAEGLQKCGISAETISVVSTLTKWPGQSQEDYEEAVLKSYRAMLVKREDLRTNMDLRRLKSRNITDKDIERAAKYMRFYAKIDAQLAKEY